MVDAKQPDTAITRADAARRPTVFLSYGRVDRAAAEGLARALERAVSLDPRRRDAASTKGAMD